MSFVHQTVNGFIDLAIEDTESALSSAWENLQQKKTELSEPCFGRLQKGMVRTIVEEVNSLRGDLAAARVDSKALSAENARVAVELTRATRELDRLSSETTSREKVHKAEMENLRTQMLSTQGPILQAIVYTLILFEAFGS